MLSSRIVLFALLLSASTGAFAEPMQVGGDTYVGGASAVTSSASARDLFASGFRVAIDDRVEKDAHGLGFSVNFDAPVAGDAYAAGFSVDIDQPVGDDLTASGFSVSLAKGAGVGGNARLMGGTVNVAGPVAGSLIAAAGSFSLEAAVTGDLLVTAGDITFGDGARVDGILTYRSPQPLDVPASVASPERVRYEAISMSPGLPDLREGLDGAARSYWPSAASVFFAFVLGLVFVAAVAAAFLAFAPNQVERLRGEAIARPWTGMAFGALGLATLIGSIPVAGMTLIGAPLIPLLLAALVVVWFLAWLAGAYALSWRIAGAFRPLDESLLTRLIVIVGGAVVLALVNYIPVVGWLINLATTFLGLGAVAARACAALSARRGDNAAASTAAAIETPPSAPASE